MVEGDFNIDGIYGVGIGTQLTEADQQKMYSKWKVVHIISKIYILFLWSLIWELVYILIWNRYILDKTKYNKLDLLTNALSINNQRYNLLKYILYIKVTKDYKFAFKIT
jgi:hypothetical protein